MSDCKPPLVGWVGFEESKKTNDGPPSTCMPASPASSLAPRRVTIEPRANIASAGSAPQAEAGPTEEAVPEEAPQEAAARQEAKKKAAAKNQADKCWDPMDG